MSEPNRSTQGVSLSERLGDAFGPMLAGLIMLPVAAVVLWWNELGAIERHRALDEGATSYVSTSGTEIDPANEGKLVHVVARAESDGTLADEDFAVEAPGALRLIRNVEMFQWRERADDRGDLPLGGGEPGSGPSYVGEWASQPIDSSRFQRAELYANPDALPYESREWRAGQVRLGAYELGDELVGRISGSERLRHLDPAAEPLAEEDFAGHHQPAGMTGVRPGEAAGSGGRGAEPAASGSTGATGTSGDAGPEGEELTGEDETTPGTGFRVTPEGFLFVGAGSPSEPQVGDIRVEHRVVHPQVVTVVAAQRGRGFDTYTTANGEELFYVMTGEKSADQVFKQAEQGNRVMSWAMRAGGVLLVFIGLSTMLRPTLLLTRSKPWAWRLIGNMGGGPALLMSMALAAGVIALVWLAYRPLAALLVLGLAVALGWLADRIGLRHRARMVRSLVRASRAHQTIE